MSIAAEQAVREWVSARPIVGEGRPLAMGAYLRRQRSPDTGAYTVLSRQSEGVTRVVAEDGGVSVARIQFLVFAGTEEAAENAAAALRSEVEKLTGCPERCGDTSTWVLAADNLTGPMFIDNPAAEQYCFQVGADFLLTA